MGKTLRRDKAITKGGREGGQKKAKVLEAEFVFSLLLRASPFQDLRAPGTSLSAFGVGEKGLQRLQKDKDKMCPPNRTSAGFALEVSLSSWLVALCGLRVAVHLGLGGVWGKAATDSIRLRCLSLCFFHYQQGQIWVGKGKET